MNCVELQESLAEVEDGSTVEQRAHLRGCPTCCALVNELDLIIEAAGHLQAADEPSARVWNSIEVALKQEGLIRRQPSRSLFPSFGAAWGAVRWLAPAAAMVLIAVGIYVRREVLPAPSPVALTAPAPYTPDLNDEDLMQEVADNSPAMKSQYAENLRQVNDSIRDLQTLVEQSPNDWEARRSLMDAYQQKSMLFELAMDHTR